MKLEEFEKEQEKKKEVILPNNADTVMLESGKEAILIKPSDEGTVVKKAIVKVPTGITYMIMDGEYTMVPCVNDRNMNTLRVTKKDDALKQVFEFAEAQMSSDVSGN